MGMIDTAGNLVTLGVAYKITDDLLNPRRRKPKRKRR